MVSYNIVWSPSAKLTYMQVLEYLYQEWTEKEIRFFMLRTNEVIKHITTTPLLYPYSKESDTRKCVVVKQVSLFYRLKELQVEILMFWDNRQNPSNLSL